MVSEQGDVDAIELDERMVGRCDHDQFVFAPRPDIHPRMRHRPLDQRDIHAKTQQQVEDSLSDLRVLNDEAKTQDAAVAAANRALEQSTNRYKGGIDTYLTVITAQSAALANERTAVSLLTRRLTSTVLLVKALGGGWDVSKLPAVD